MTRAEQDACPNLTELLDQSRARVVESFLKKSGVQIAQSYSEDIDGLIRAHCEFLAADERFADIARRCALIAVGGYGRRELNLYSDIDLLFLLPTEPTPEEEEFLRAFLYPLWNLKIDLGYSVKTVPQIISELENDLDLTTSLIGMHFVWGDESLAGLLLEKFRLHVTLRVGEKLSSDLIAMQLARHRKHSGTLLLLQPHIKDAAGALRDVHTLQWLSFIHFGEPDFNGLVGHGYLKPQEERRLRKAHSFLLDLRNAMHEMEGRKADLLNFERQIKAAPLLGIQGLENMLPEEQLMRTYYEQAGVVERLSHRVIRRLEDRPGPKGTTPRRPTMGAHRLEGDYWTRNGKVWVAPRESNNVARDPHWMMDLFAIIALYGLEPDDFTLDLVEHHLIDIDDEFRASPINRDRFLLILKNKRHAGRALRAMHRSGFLDAYIPEFSLVRNLPRIDYYHQFTVDEHLLRSVECAVDLFAEGSGFDKSHTAKTAARVMRWDLLVFALLIHDVGKGEGRGHVIRGAHIAQRIADRLCLEPREAEVLHELVLNHQKISSLALKRNPEDPGVPRTLASDIRDPEILRMLYVLTCCDMRAVSTDSWNDWRGLLLTTLYERAMSVLEGREEHLPQTAPSRSHFFNHVVEKYREQYGDLADDRRSRIDHLIRDLPDRYILTTPPPDAARHMRMAERIDGQTVVVFELEPVEGSNYAFLHTVLRDAPGLFVHLCGALASRKFNILSAQIYTARNGVCVDVFQIQDADGNQPTDRDLIDRLAKNLNEVLRGCRQTKWEDQIPRQTQPVSTARLDMRPPTVTITNDKGEGGQTVIEVKAPDRPGLLYEITRVLDEFRINIHVALVATESYQIVDVFYVTDWENSRLEPGPEVQAIQKALLEVVSPDNPIDNKPSSSEGLAKEYGRPLHS